MFHSKWHQERRPPFSCHSLRVGPLWGFPPARPARFPGS